MLVSFSRWPDGGPTPVELRHDFLWRTTRDLPERSKIAAVGKDIAALRVDAGHHVLDATDPFRRHPWLER